MTLLKGVSNICGWQESPPEEFRINLFLKDLKFHIKSGLARPIATGRAVPSLQRGSVTRTAQRKFDKGLAGLRLVNNRECGQHHPTTTTSSPSKPDIMFSHNALNAYLDTIKDSKLQQHRRAKKIYDFHFKTILQPREEKKIPQTPVRRPMQVHKSPVVHKLNAAMMKEALRERAIQINKRTSKGKDLQPQIHCQRALSLKEQPILPCKRMINR